MVRNHQSVDWSAYFQRIKTQCPWSGQAYQRNLIDFVRWQGTPRPIGDFSARIYSTKLNRRRLKKLCKQLDQQDTECEWLWSHPSYGPYATEIPILIQQPRQILQLLRQKLAENFQP